MRRGQLLTVVLWLQGLYYGLTGIWAAVSLESFFRVSGLYSGPFEAHAIAALSILLGLAFIVGANQPRYRRFAGWLLLGAAVAVIVPELAYFGHIRDTLTVLDIPEEIIAGIAAALGIKWEAPQQPPDALVNHSR